MKLKRVISGGQSGVDKTGLECARELGLETGGTAPKGYRTENGPDYSLRGFGLVESPSSSYPPRTRANVANADATVWFGNVGSPGYLCTMKESYHHTKPFFSNPDLSEMRMIADTYEVINVAGNRASTNPKVVQEVRAAFASLKE